MIVLLALLACPPTDESACLEGYERSEDGNCEPMDNRDTADTGDLPIPSLCDAEMEGSGFKAGTLDCSNGVCEVEAGPFWRGSGEGLRDECPAAEVTLSAFAIDATEVTRGDYASCASLGVCEAMPQHCEDLLASLSEAPDNHPAICVTWSQAATYCAFRDGRLPTEAEWEKAARGSEGATWSWGSTPPSCQEANFRFVSWYCEESVVAVGTYPESRSAYGLYDTVGNAWEWVGDYYDAGYYEDSPESDPQGPEDDCRSAVGEEAGTCTDRVMRGGAFNTTEATTRGPARSFEDPGIYDINMGFRCAYDR